MDLRNRCRVALPFIVVAAISASAMTAQAGIRKTPLFAAHNSAGKANDSRGQWQDELPGQDRWGGGPPPGQGPGGPPPGMAESMEAWRTWHAAHPNVTALQGTVHGLSALESDPTLRLNGKQMRIVLPILKEWRTKKTISDTQAKQVREKIGAALNPAQKAKLSSTGRDFDGMGRPPRGGPGGPPPGGMGGPSPDGMGGPPPGGTGGPPPGMDAHSRGFAGREGMGGPPPGGRFGMGHGGPPSFPKPRDYNPLNPETSPLTFDVGRNKAALDKLMRQLSSTR